MTSYRSLQCRLSLISTIAAFAFTLAAPATALAADEDATLISLVQQHVKAQADFNVPALTALTTDNYVEVSPLGGVDTREKVLAFYAPDKKTAAPVITVEEPLVRVSGDTAVLIAKLSMTVTAGGQQRPVALRASYVAKKDGGAWKLLSAHYSGIAPKKPAQ
ncbi:MULTISPECIES: nuclear transport factor 2 family protein [unclassified Janthinobacterium]|uniref:nuclear transport factor 2 family protein n=1 Tax=unclassified Janthinobacterium TaxID=2610881 RepID=UPI0016143A9F|nr:MULTISPECIES: nuclear transport factor 2 family protein [unclassified Janthinobacterium]MBB5367909.1 ketosteroid isomerase-like protein [Janthinobacterium sp. K2C7]MBB5379613.1 ketosteroid isomerase-like protein [Janthinobacterium sp. K2Li3]MBB5386291.1 ketosteroid isomerase-like protein [Janthinobacterium sp. K2E3]